MEEEKGPVCVTGGTGFIGSWLVMKLLQHGYTVRATVRSDPETLATSQACPEHQRSFTSSMGIFTIPKVLMQQSKDASGSSMLLILCLIKNLMKNQ